MSQEEVYETAGRLVGIGLPWEAIWETPEDALPALLDGLRMARGGSTPEDDETAVQGLLGGPAGGSTPSSVIRIEPPSG